MGEEADPSYWLVSLVRSFVRFSVVVRQKSATAVRQKARSAQAGGFFLSLSVPFLSLQRTAVPSSWVRASQPKQRISQFAVGAGLEELAKPQQHRRSKQKTSSWRA